MDKNKKLLCLIPSLSSGGAERQMIQLLSFLNQKGCRPTVINYSRLKDYEHNLNINRYIILEKNKIKRFLKILAAIKKEKPDVILSFGQSANILLIMLSFFYRKAKIIVSGRNTPPQYDFNVRCIYNLYRFADVIVLNSKGQTDFIKKYAPFLSHKLKTILNYTDVSRFSVINKDKSNVVKVGILARYSPQKNILRFLDVVKILNQKFPAQIEFYWYGQKYFDTKGYPTKLSQYYLQCENIRKKEALNNVHFNDFSNDVNVVFREMDAICLPSLFEGFSNTLSEAICCGKPVVASDVSDNSSFVHSNINGFLFDPNDTQSMVDAFVQLLALTDDDWQRFQNNSRQIAENLFSKERFIRDYIEVLFN
jgi:glycosyltransferase involved in cell wall biosynthesis